MSIPIIESIAANILTTVNGVTEGNGYNQTIDAKRPSRVDYDTDTVDDLTAEVFQTEPEKLVGPNIYYSWRQGFDIVVYAINDDGSAVTIDTRLNQIAADISKALRVDITRGGYAYQTDIGPARIGTVDDGSKSLVVLQITVDYRVLKSDPYTQG